MIFGIETEFFSNKTFEQVASIVSSILGVDYIRQINKVKVLSEYNDIIDIPVYTYATDMGDCTLKLESNSYSRLENENDYSDDSSLHIFELVFPPVDETYLPFLYKVHTKLGHHFEGIGHPVSLQVNLDCSDFSCKKVCSIVENYNVIRPRYVTGNAERLHYIKPFDRNFDFDSYEDFFYDYFYNYYRQLVGINLTDKEVIEAYLHNSNSDVVNHIVKYSSIKVSSLLLYNNKYNPLTDIIEGYNWVWTIPAIEFRDFDNDFDLESKIKIVKDCVEC